MKRCATVFALVLSAAALHGQTLTALVPRGGQRGTELELRGYGRAIGDPLSLLFEREGIELLEIAGDGPDRLRAKIRIAADCPLGGHPIWLCTKRGLSRMTLFHVGVLPEITEEEPNDSREQAATIANGVTVNGRITAGDADWFCVEVGAAQDLYAEVEGVRLDVDWDPCLNVYDAAGRLISRNDDSPLGRLDPIAHVVFEQPGHCFLELRDAGWGGSSGSLYRLHVGGFPRPIGVMPCVGAPGAEVEVSWLGPGAEGTRSTVVFPKRYGRQPVFLERDGATAPTPVWVRVRGGATAVEGTDAELAPPFGVQGIIAKPGEVDRIAFVAKKGQDLNIRSVSRRLRSPIDTVLVVRDAKRRALASNDDGAHPDSQLRFRVPEDGTYTLDVRDQIGRGGPDYFYAIDVDPRGSALRTYQSVAGQLPEAFGVVVPRGNRTATVIAASGLDRRAGIELGMEDLPGGVEATAPRFVDGADMVPVLLRAATDAPNQGVLAGFTATAEKEPKTRSAGFLHVFPRLRVFNNQPYAFAMSNRMPVVVADPCPFRVDVEAPRVPIIRGSPMSLPVVVTRDEGFEGAVRVRMLWNPPGISAGQVTVPGDRSDSTLALNANANAATRTWPVVVIAYAAIAGVTQVVSSEIFELTVSEPWIDARLGRVRVDQGAAASFEVALERKRDFHGEFAVELLGLPRGVKTEFPKVDQDAAKAAFTLMTDPKSPRGRHRSQYVRIRVPTPDGEVVHHFRGGEIRIDRPLPDDVKRSKK